MKLERVLTMKIDNFVRFGIPYYVALNNHGSHVILTCGPSTWTLKIGNEAVPLLTWRLVYLLTLEEQWRHEFRRPSAEYKTASKEDERSAQEASRAGKADMRVPETSLWRLYRTRAIHKF